MRHQPWWGYTRKKEQDLIDRLLYRMKRRGFLSKDAGEGVHCASNAGSKLFRAVYNNSQHVLSNLFPQHKNTGHMRPRVHSYTLPIKDEKNFIPRMLYTNTSIFTRLTPGELEEFFRSHADLSL